MMQGGLQRWAGILSACAASFFLVHCSPPEPPVDIAVMTKLEAGSIIGTSEVNAAKSFLEEQGITNINIVPLNDNWDPETAKKVFDESIAGKVHLLITSHVSSCAVAIAEAIDRNKILTIVAGATTDALSGKDDYILRSIPDVRTEQKAIAEHLNGAGAQRLAIVRDTVNAAYTEPALAAFREASTVPAIRELPVNADALDLAAIDQWLKQDPFDTIYLLIGGYKSNAVGALAQLALKANPSAKIMLTPWVKSPALVEAAGPAIAQCTLPSHYPPRGQSAAVDGYVDAFKQRYGYAPTFISLNIYTALAILDDAIGAGKRSPEDIRAYILAKRVFDTPLATVSFDECGDAKANLFFITDIPREF